MMVNTIAAGSAIRAERCQPVIVIGGRDYPSVSALTSATVMTHT
jgi:hypothetical protein